ncbi:hypothetical protein DXG01_002402 [Tephrocybe rancida]|nr:hypothetical protein DXG01_002402 [Tephrocybe rancida]
MKSKYQITRFETVEDYFNDAAMGPLVAQHVRTLRISPRELAFIHPREDSTFLAMMLPGIYSYAAKTQKSLQRLVSFIKSLSDVTSMVLKLRSYDDEAGRQVTAPIVEAGWATFGTNLRALKLNLSLEGSNLISLCSTTFPRLVELDIKLLKELQTTTGTTHTVCEVFVPFITNHRLTLCSLQIDIHFPGCSDFSISSFLLRLRHFPELAKLGLAYDFIDKNLSNDHALRPNPRAVPGDHGSNSIRRIPDA